MDEAHEKPQHGKKRKKKRSHIQMAKKFARSRSHGHDLDPETYQYMVRILELVRDGFPSAEEKQIFVENVYEQTSGHELEYAKNQIGSRVLDSLLKYASLEAIQRLITAFNDSLRPLSSDRFASHVIEKIIVVCADRGNRQTNVKKTVKTEDTKDDFIVVVKESEIKVYNDIVLKLSRYFTNNVEEFVFDTYANHLLRTVYECLSGLIDNSNEDDRKKIIPGNKERRPVVQEYKDLLIQSCTRLCKWPQFLEFGQDEITSGLVQSILYSLKDIDPQLTKTYIKIITNDCFKPGEDKKLSNIFDSESSVRLLEACIATGPLESYKFMYEQFFKDNLRQLSMTKATNFSVQRLLDHCHAKEELEPMFDEIATCFSDILILSHTGILSSLANACTKLQIKQGAFVNAIMKLLQCDSTPTDQLQVVKCTSALKTVEQLKNTSKDKSNFPVHLHGSLIVQAMLHFNKPIKIVNSILEMDIEDVLYLFSDPKGSRIADAFMESKYIGEKSREKLAKKLKGSWSHLAQSTHGSRSLEKIWKWAHGNYKNWIMDDLAATGEGLRSTKSGRIIATKFNVPLYARSKKDWLESQGKEDKMRAMFANIIGDSTSKES